MKTIVITGATSGIGLAVLKSALQKGYHVIGIGRSQEKMDRIQNELHTEHLTFLKADLMELEEIKQLGDEIKAYFMMHQSDYLYALINNAGCVRSWYSTNSMGYEQQFALNHLAGYALTSYLLPLLIQGQGRILFTSSGSHRHMKIHWNDLMFEKRYHPLLAYKQSKLCNVIMALILNHRYQDQGIHAYAVDPGLVYTEIGNKDTGGLVRLVWNFRKKKGVHPDQPAQTYLYLLDQENPPQGLYYKGFKSIKYNKQANLKNAERCILVSERLTNIKLGGS